MMSVMSWKRKKLIARKNVCVCWAPLPLFFRGPRNMLNGTHMATAGENFQRMADNYFQIHGPDGFHTYNIIV